MNFWVIIEYLLKYKYDYYIFEIFVERFRRVFDVVFFLD